MIEIPLTQAQFDQKKAMLKEKRGIDLAGDTGTITSMGVTARYTYAAGRLGVEILEKPFFVTEAYCEEQLRAFLAA